MLVNLTPHQINVFDGTKLVAVLPPSGQVARVTMETRRLPVIDGDVPFYRTTPGEVTGLPEPDGMTIFVVSALVRLAVPHRGDVASPGELVRNEAGQPIGCQGLVLN